MSSGVTLVVSGRDNPLTIDPDMSFFKTLYKRHTNFSSVIDKLTLQTKPVNNGSSKTRVEIKGDLLSYMYITCSSLDNGETLLRKWSRVIDKVELFIGGQLIDTQYYEYSTKIATDVQASTLTRGTKGSVGSEYSYFYPLKFFFCEHWASSIPLISLNYHDVELVIHWGTNLYLNDVLGAYLADVEQYKNQNISYTDLLRDVTLYQNVSNVDVYTNVQSNIVLYQAVTIPDDDYTTNVQSNIILYGNVSIPSEDVYTNVQSNIVLYQAVVVPDEDEYTNVQSNIVLYQAIDSNDYANIQADLVLYQAYGQTDAYTNVSANITDYQGVTIPSTGQYIDVQSNVTIYQAAATDGDRIADASNVVNGFSNLTPTPTLTENKTYYVAVKQVGDDNKYYINGELQAVLTFRRGSTYIFDLTNGDAYTNHPFRFSTLSDGTHTGGTIYDTGVTLSAVNKTVTIVVDAGAPNTLYYFCTVHSGMGSSITVMDARIVPTYQSLTDGYIIYDYLTDSSGSFPASDALNDFITSLNNSENINASTNVLAKFNVLPTYPSNVLTQNTTTGFLTYDGTEDTALDYAPTNSLTTYMDARVTEERSNAASNLVTDHSGVTDTGNTLTFTNTTGFLTYTTSTPATLTDSISSFDASIELNTNMGLYNNALRIAAAGTLSTSWASTADASAPYSNTFTIDGTTGYITYESTVDSSGDFGGSNLLNNVMTLFHNYDRSNIAQDVIDSHALATADSNTLTKTDLTGLIIYETLTDSDTPGPAPASNLLNRVMNAFHNYDRINVSSNIVSNYALTNDSNVLAQNVQTGFIRYNGVQDTPSTLDGSNLLYTNMTAFHYQPRTSEASNIITGWALTDDDTSNTLTQTSPEGFLVYQGLTDSVGDFQGTNLLDTVMGGEHYAIRLARSANVLTSYASLDPPMTNVLTRSDVTGFLIYNGTLTDTAATPPDYAASNLLRTDVLTTRMSVRDSNASNVVNNWPDIFPSSIIPTKNPVNYFITFNGNAEDTNAAYPSADALIAYVTEQESDYATSEFNLMGRFIYLDKNERRYMSDRSADYVITQTQRIPTQNKKEVDLTFNHPVSFIASTASNFNASNKMLLELNGEPVGDPKPAIPHYKQISTYYHTTYGTNQYTTMMYPFCLDASNKEPTGSLNFSRLDSARLILDQSINGAIYAVNYNILRISNGTAGLLYA